MAQIDERQVVVFTLGDEEFGVNISEVREIIRSSTITKLPNTAPYIKGVINLRGSIIVVIDLSMKLMFQARAADKDTRIIVIELGGNTVGMVVDSATEVLRLSSNQIQPPPQIITSRINANYIEGVGVVGERLLIILDLAKVIESQDVKVIERMQQEKPLPELPQIKQETAPQQAKAAAPQPKDPHPALQDVPEEYHFITHDGRPLKNVRELLGYIKGLDDERFRQFVNEEKNDFCNWITHCVKDQDLAYKIGHLRSKDEVTREMRDRLLHIQTL